MIDQDRDCDHTITLIDRFWIAIKDRSMIVIFNLIYLINKKDLFYDNFILTNY